MKRLTLLIIILSVGLIGSTHAQPTQDDFLGLPVPQGTVGNRTDDRLDMVSPMTHDQVLEFYKEKLDGMEDIKIRNWKTQSYIEDDSNRPWHSITIEKEYNQGTNISIVRDNWTWIIGTLILRYIGVFVVLLLLLIGMTVSGKIISSSVKKSEAEKKAA